MLTQSCQAGVTTSRGQYEADYVVLAAGRGIPQLAAQAGVQVPLADKPATLNVYTEPAPRMLHHILLSGALRCPPFSSSSASPCAAALWLSLMRVCTPYMRSFFEKSIHNAYRLQRLADALFLRQARDGTLLISIYKEDAAAALRLAPDAPEDPAQLQAIGQQVSLLPGIPFRGSAIACLPWSTMSRDAHCTGR